MAARYVIAMFVAIGTMVGSALGETTPTADLVFDRASVPYGLVPGDIVSVQRVISATINAKGEVDRKTRDCFKGLEVVKIRQDPGPETPGMRVTFAVTEQQAREMADLMMKGIKLKDKNGKERLYLPLLMQLERERLTGIPNSAEDLVKEGAIRLEGVALVDPPEKKTRLQFGKEVGLEFDLFIGEHFKNPVLATEGRATSAKKAPVNVAYHFVFLDDKGAIVAATSGNVRGIYPGTPLAFNGEFVRGREADFRSIAKYRFTATVFPSIESDASSDRKPNDVPKLTSPQNSAELVNRKSRYSQWNFRWELVDGAVAYQLQVQRQGAPQPLVNVQLLMTNYTLRGSAGPIPEAERAGWKWRVRALVNNRWGDWSEERTFSVGP